MSRHRDGHEAGEHHPVLDALPTAVLLVDDGGRVRFANTRAAQALRRSREELAGTPLERWLAPLGHLVELAGTTPTAPLRIADPNGVGRQFGFRIAPLPPDEGGGHAIVFRDVGDMLRLRDEHERLLRLAAVGDVLPGLLHEIKNPLAAISTAVEVLAEEVPEGHVRRELSAVLGEVRRIKLAIEGIGLFRNDLREPRRTAIDAALREAFLVLERQMQAKGVTGTLLCPRLPLLPLDAAVLRALLFNLTSNALHACAPGDTIRVEVRFRADEARLELHVADTGCGMPPEVLARCRELFFTTKASGSGVGLALCVRAVERAGGALLIDSQPGQGTSVLVHLPVAGTAARPPLPRTEQGEAHVTH